MQFDVWRNEWRRISLNEPTPECRTCGLDRYETLEAEAGISQRRYAGGCRAGQPATRGEVDLPALAERLRAAGEVQVNPYLLRLRAGDYELTVFQDARAIIRGTDDVPTARSLYAKYIGN